MTEGAERVDSNITEATAREHVRSYTEHVLTIVTETTHPDIEETRLALETALDHFERVVHYGTAIAYQHEQYQAVDGQAELRQHDRTVGDIGPNLRTLTSELAIDRLDPFGLDDLRALLYDGGVETAADGSASFDTAGGSIAAPWRDRSIGFERWLLTEFGTVVSIPIRDSETAVRRVLEATADRYAMARTDEPVAIEDLSTVVPILESLYRLYVWLTIEKPLAAANEDELGRTMISLTAAITSDFGGR